MVFYVLSRPLDHHQRKLETSQSCPKLTLPTLLGQFAKWLPTLKKRPNCAVIALGRLGQLKKAHIL